MAKNKSKKRTKKKTVSRSKKKRTITTEELLGKKAPVAPPNTTMVEVHIKTAELFDEYTQDKSFSLSGSIPDIVDMFVEAWVHKLLFDCVSPRQWNTSQPLEEKIELAIAFLKAMRGATGYCASPRFGPYAVYAPQDGIWPPESPPLTKEELMSSPMAEQNRLEIAKGKSENTKVAKKPDALDRIANKTEESA